jgi:DNA-dependent RNA polymerase auxiliary subunit epsilon
MTTYKITYTKTGKRNQTDVVMINDNDKKKNGERVNDMIGAIEYFEELAETWGSYENRHAITKIELV